jgi:hypothetical protein
MIRAIFDWLSAIGGGTVALIFTVCVLIIALWPLWLVLAALKYLLS